MAEASAPPVIPCFQVAEIELPDELDRLYDLAYNLWWTWRPEARHLFASIDSGSWGRYRNPVELLHDVDRSHWELLLESDPFMERYAAVRQAFDSYLAGGPESWFARRFEGWRGGPVAYFSMEFGLHQSLPLYSGGLGVLSGDHCKAASDLGLPFVGVGLLYRRGYFQQSIDADGYQQHFYPESNFHRLPVRPAMDRRGREVVVRVPLPGREVAAKVWLAQVGRVPLLLLDTDVTDNDPADRPITGVLYVRGREMRLCQEMILGVGGLRALAALGIEPAVWHLNEGHSSLLQLERLREAVAGGDRELTEALARVRRNALFTTHTTVPAGNEQFERALAGRYLEPWTEPLGTAAERLLELGQAEPGGGPGGFNLTALAIRTSARVNGVSRLNSEVAERLWRHLLPAAAGQPPVLPITNGVHVPTWLGVEMRTLLARHLGGDWLEDQQLPRSWERVAAIPDHELWGAHQAQKERLLRFTRSRLREQYARHGHSPDQLREVAELFDPGMLTIGFARRFATYKRAALLFRDLGRLRGLLAHAERPVQIFMAGKAHPADRPGQELIREIFALSRDGELRGRVVFLENYDMRVARMLVQGADVWLNTPRRPLEACGTSGQKAAINGVLNCSILDGWWPEGYDGSNGWAIDGGNAAGDDEAQDELDAKALFEVLEQRIVPAFYEREGEGVAAGWVARMKRSMITVGSRFTASRMVREYADRAYAPLAGHATPEPVPQPVES